MKPCQLPWIVTKNILSLMMDSSSNKMHLDFIFQILYVKLANILAILSKYIFRIPVVFRPILKKSRVVLILVDLK